MSNIRIEDLSDAIEQELTMYSEELVDAIDKAGDRAVKNLVKLTRASAPKGARGSFKRHISSKQLAKTKRASSHVWYVKPPDHRLTHLLANGHATKDGGRTKSDPFLRNALDVVLPEYEREVEEAVRNGR